MLYPDLSRPVETGMKVGSKHEINNKTNNNDDDKDKT